MSHVINKCMDVNWLEPTVGYFTTNFNSGADWAFAVDKQSDGKIILAGTVDFTAIGSTKDSPDKPYNDNTSGLFGCLRLTTIGALDLTFGTSGKFSAKVSSSVSNTCVAMKVLSDDRIVLAGYVYNSSKGASDYCVVMLTASGALDTTFNSTGILILNPNMGSGSGNRDFRVVHILQQSDGKLVLVGPVSTDPQASSSGNGGAVTQQSYTSFRISLAGVLDTAYGGTGVGPPPAGYTRFDYSAGQDNPRAGAIQSDDKVITCGQNSNTKGIAIRVLSDGSLDTGGWNSGGSVPGWGKEVPLTAGQIQDGDIASSSGKFVGVGFYTGGNYFTARYTTTGVLDTTYGLSSSGKFTASGPAPRGSNIDSAEKTVFVGEDSSNDFFIKRILADGSALDTAFNSTGANSASLSASSDRAYGVVVSSGKYVVAGVAGHPLGTAKFGCVQFRSDGSQDMGFGIPS